jgi:hypothetical protein
MTPIELKDKIKELTLHIYQNIKKSNTEAFEYDELVKFPELKKVIVTLLTSDFNSFMASVDWVAPRPTTFRINLKNGTSFYLLWNERSWVAQIEGKKYYLLNLPEEERASEAISRILRYGEKDIAEESKNTSEEAPEKTPEEAPKETPEKTIEK